MKKYVTVLFLGLALLPYFRAHGQNKAVQKPQIAFSFDDGQTNDVAGYPLATWNKLLLAHLKKHQVKAVLFSSGANKKTAKGKYLLSSWNDAGHLIGNHTFTHPNFNSKNTSLEDFEWELMGNDSIIRKYANFYPYFRFPYLKEGNTKEKVEGFRAFMQAKGYTNGHVTIDASDWYIDSRLVKRLRENPKADVSGFRDYYKAHLMNRAMYYDSLANQLTDKPISHVILLHHNLAAALFLGDLIQHFKDNGWEVINPDIAYQHPIYKEIPNTIPAGESLIWALVKQTGKFDKVLRYPAEDGAYEKEKMDKLGL